MRLLSTWRAWVILALMSLSTLTYGAEPKGTLLIGGGALRVDNAVIWERLVALAGGRGAQIAVIPSASANPQRAGDNMVELLKRYGAEAFVVPISVRLQDSDYQAVARDQAIAARVRGAAGVFMTGGDQERITRVLFDDKGQRTPLLQAIWDVYERGGVVAGTSAGAAVMSATMISEGRSSISTLQGGIIEGKTIAPGLGFIGAEVFVDQHFIARGRFARMIPAMLAAKYQLGIGVDENSALVVTPGGNVEVIGHKGAILIDLKRARVDQGQPAFNVSDVRISYFDRGDRYNFRSQEFTPAAHKVGGAINRPPPYLGSARFYPNILANTVAVDLMQSLIDSPQEAAIGLAFASPGTQQASLGFEFRFSKVPESRGWVTTTSDTDDYSVLNLRLDVRPVRMATPLYQPLD